MNKYYFNLWLTLPLLLLIACQATLAEILATDIVVPTRTSSPMPPSATFTATATATYVPATATSTLASFPEEALNSGINLLSAWNLEPVNALAPLAISPFDHFYFSYPVSVTEAGRRYPSSRYGNDQKAENGAGHTGLDIGLDTGTSILAAAEGRVIFTGYGLLTGYDNLDDPFGLSIVIRHDFGYEGQPLYTAYSHLSYIQVDVGQTVGRGEKIGRSGDTGFSSGPHLHFEVRLGKNTIYNSRNPELWISPPDGWGVLVGQLYTSYGARLINQAIKVSNLDTGRIRWVFSYATSTNIEADEYFDENFVLGDLPAGRYEIAIPYVIGTLRTEIDIEAGTISYFNFQGTNGFKVEWPPIALPENLPQ